MSAYAQKVVTMSANYQGQTGPKSPAGKNKVRFNALKHGLYAKSKILPTENPKEYQRLLRAVFEDINPQGMIEERIAREIGEAMWAIDRAETHRHAERDAIFDSLKPSDVASALGLSAEHQGCAPAYLTNPQHTISKKIAKACAEQYQQYLHFMANASQAQNFNLVWRNYTILFLAFGLWVDSQTETQVPFFTNNQKDISLGWQQNREACLKYLKRYSFHLYFASRWPELRPQVRVWMETWFYLKRQEQYRIDHFDIKLLKERRNLQGLLDALYKHRKSVHDYAQWQSHWHASAALQEKN